jgi:hypothetical protein
MTNNMYNKIKINMKNKITIKIRDINNEIMAYMKGGIKSGKNRSWPKCSYFLYVCLRRLKTKKSLSARSRFGM